MSHKEYTIIELAHDPSFCRMVKGIANEEEVERWNTWIESDENRAKARSAISDIVGFEFDDPEFPDIEQKTLTFSDGSRVVLNSTSNLTYWMGLFTSNQWKGWCDLYRMLPAYRSTSRRTERLSISAHQRIQTDKMNQWERIR